MWSEVPRYRQLAQILRAQIRGGLLAPLELLPSEHQLSERYGIGRNAVRQALGVLRDEGYLETLMRIGTRVRSRENWPGS